MFLYIPVCPGLCTCRNLEQSPNKYLLLLPFDPFSCLLPNLFSSGSIPLEKSQALASLNLSGILCWGCWTQHSPLFSGIQPSTAWFYYSMVQEAGIKGGGVFVLVCFGFFNLPVTLWHQSFAHFWSPVLIWLTPTFYTGSPKSYEGTEVGIKRFQGRSKHETFM